MMSRYDIRPSGVDLFLCQSKVHSVNATGWLHIPRRPNFWNRAMHYDTGMTAASAFPELAHENAWDVPALAGCWSRRQVSDWIDFGGHAPYLWTDEVRGTKSPENSQLRRAGVRRRR